MIKTLKVNETYHMVCPADVIFEDLYPDVSINSDYTIIEEGGGCYVIEIEKVGWDTQVLAVVAKSIVEWYTKEDD